MFNGNLKKLKDNHPTSSWAIWSQEFPKEGCVEEDASKFYDFIQQSREQLRPSVVLLSLNSSTSMPSDFLNFHSTDPKHRNQQFVDVVKEGGLEGAFMTDLVEETVMVDSGKVEATSEDVENLFDQLSILGQDEYHVVCFLKQVFTTLRDYFDANVEQLPHNIKSFKAEKNGIRLNFYRVWFHANWGANKDKIPELKKQLSYINSEPLD